MILTRKDLKEYQAGMRVTISADIQEELLDRYGHLEIDDEGHVHVYTEQDIYEQMRKMMRTK